MKRQPFIVSNAALSFLAAVACTSTVVGLVAWACSPKIDALPAINVGSFMVLMVSNLMGIICMRAQGRTIIRQGEVISNQIETITNLAWTIEELKEGANHRIGN